jgi:glutamate dehydrogenase/leucine dehydrogenase
MLELLKKFEARQPEIVFEWHDEPTGAEGWLVINSLRGGAAGGGTRMRKGLDKNEVLSLAKTMEIKFAVCGPDIGGGKSGINFDPNDPRKLEVLERWYKAVMPLLKSYYGTGGDLNIDEVREVIPITEKYGLLHPQEGVLTGHFSPGRDDKKLIITNLDKGVSKVLDNPKYSPDLSKNYVVADMITGWGVSEAVRVYYKLWHGAVLDGKKAIIQGWGNVASAAAFYLAQQGVKVVGIIDRAGGIIKKEGLGFEEISELFNNKANNALISTQIIPFDEANEMIWKLNADIFIPGASSRLVSMDNLEQMKGNVKVFSCGANVPFNDAEIFYGPTSEYADKNFAVIPDFIANCGMARTFAYLMGKDAVLTDDAIFGDVTATIEKALTALHYTNVTSSNLMESSFGMVLDKLMN